jgi:hypothetical protein
MTSLYRFFSCKDAHPENHTNRDIDALATSYLWFSKVADFNDPFEGLYGEQLTYRDARDITDDEAQTIMLGEAMGKGQTLLELDSKYIIANLTPVEIYLQKVRICSAIQTSLARFLKDATENHRVCCFNRNFGEKNALENKLMWSHYADGLRGMVIEFDDAQLDASLEGMNGERTQGGIIDYSGFNSLDAVELMVEYARSRQGGIAKVLLRKCKEWEYEQEHRVVSLQNKMYYNPNSIKSITIGQRMQCSTRGELITVAHRLGLMDRLQVATINKKTFSIKVESFNGIH